MKCAVYEYVGSWGGGLVFIPIEDETDWVKFNTEFGRIENYMKLGVMEVDEKIIIFRSFGPHPKVGFPRPIREADYSHYE